MVQVGCIGLGRMGFNLTLNLLDHGHEVVVYNRSPGKIKQAVEAGAQGAYSLQEVVDGLAPPRVIWLMLPAGPPVDEVLAGLAPWLVTGDTIIDGGNSFYRDVLP